MSRTLRLVAATVLGLSPATGAIAASWTLDQAAWSRPRDGQTVVAMAPLPAAVEAWSRRDGARLVVRHAGGEEGELWANELADWLVALGVPGSAIAVTPGGRPDVLELTIRESDDR